MSYDIIQKALEDYEYEVGGESFIKQTYDPDDARTIIKRNKSKPTPSTKKKDA